MIKLAVIMSVYKNDRLSWLKEACSSVLESVGDPLKFFIAVDGPVTDDVTVYLKSLDFRPDVVVVFNADNKGLAFRLNQLLELALKDNVEFIARMDADDYSHPTRFIKQISYFNSNPDVDVLGAGLTEVDEQGTKLFDKKMLERHDDLLASIIKKCPFNHPTVMFRSSVFERTATRYNPELQNTQDYYYWVDLLAEGFRFANIREPLVNFRIDSSFYKRRGAKKALNDFRSRLYAMKVLKRKTLYNYFVAFALLCLRLSPSWMKSWAYKKLR